MLPTSSVDCLAANVDSIEFLDDVWRGLKSPQRSLPSKYFYDQRGSQLFDQICELAEYYPTRVESGIMFNGADQMASCLGTDVRLIEYGSGSSVKTRILLDHLCDLQTYVPVDISGDHLMGIVDSLSKEFPLLDIAPVVADFAKPFDVPDAEYGTRRTCVYFPGSTIGNFTPDAASALLAGMAQHSGDDGGLLIGFDLQKDVSVLEAAYNDRAGVTAAFNLNLLTRINRELDGDIDVTSFRHHAFYNVMENRIEMHLVSDANQRFSVAGREFEIDRGETIRTEYSHKYTTDGFATAAAKVGWKCRKVWTDDQGYFAVMYLEL